MDQERFILLSYKAILKLHAHIDVLSFLIKATAITETNGFLQL
jgi:hypothetical protein